MEAYQSGILISVEGHVLTALSYVLDTSDLVVMLDAQQAYRHHLDEDPVIHWGAYVGTPDEILVSGRLSEVADRITELRAEARERKGWIMDTYLLRRG